MPRIPSRDRYPSRPFRTRPTLRRPAAVVACALAGCLVWTGSAFAAPAAGKNAAANTVDQETMAQSWAVKEPRSRPNSGLSATVALTGDGSLRLSVQRGSSTILEPSALGLTTSDASFGSGLTFLGSSERTINQTYTTPAGKRHRHHGRAHQTRLKFENGDGFRMDLLVRVTDDGVAYRYVLPEDDGEVVVESESSSFEVPATARTWTTKWGDHSEQKWFETTVADAQAGEYGYPTLFKVSGDDYMLLTESKVIDQYGATRLVLDAETDTYEVKLPDPEQTATAPMKTPWRTMIIGDLAQVVESDMVTDLSPPSKIDDTSWIEPGRVAWSWWSDHDSPQSLEIQKDYVDYAAEVGWEYVLVDAGWDPEWMPELVEYAKKRGVKTIAWIQWTAVDTERERDKRLPKWKSWGIVGLKIDYMDSNSQHMMRWYADVLADTAEYEFMVNLHGAVVPRGVRRTWPHLLTREGVRGAEYYTFGEPGEVTPTHNAILPYTRNVVGSMDYTPVTFSADNRTTSDGHELALSVVYESGLQHFADSVESYQAHPVAENFLSEVPAAWDETQFVTGSPGEEAVIARRHGKDWYVGAIASGEAREVTVPFDFLGGGKWQVELTRDGADGLVTETHAVTRGSELTVPVTENGGFVAHLTRSSR